MITVCTIVHLGSRPFSKLLASIFNIVGDKVTIHYFEDMTNYDNLLAGAKGLLGDCAKLLTGTGKDFVIVGGWSPLLLNSGAIKHPGTHDVDLLFSDGKSKGELGEIFNLFLTNGYKSSAKHEFQLLKVISVAGKEFVYNVDFLHSTDSGQSSSMFVDHLKLPVPLNEYQDETYIEKSIKAPNSEVLFTENLFDKITQDFTLPDGSSGRFSFPLINEAGLIITKADSVKNVKRKRDAFDIYLAIKQTRDYPQLVSIFKRLKKENPLVFNTLYGIKEAIEKHGMILNILDYAYKDDPDWDQQLEAVSADVDSFLQEVGLEPLAKTEYY